MNNLKELLDNTNASRRSSARENVMCSSFKKPKTAIITLLQVKESLEKSPQKFVKTMDTVSVLHTEDDPQKPVDFGSPEKVTKEKDNGDIENE